MLLKILKIDFTLLVFPAASTSFVSFEASLENSKPSWNINWNDFTSFGNSAYISIGSKTRKIKKNGNIARISNQQVLIKFLKFLILRYLKIKSKPKMLIIE